MASNPDVAWALREFRDQARRTRYELASNYYLGDHRMAFATKRFRTVFGALFQALTDNLCPAVVDSVTDRLEVTGFTSSLASQKPVQTPDGAQLLVLDDTPADRAWRIWQANRMDLRAGDVHREALVTGDGYVLVQPGPDGPVIWPQVAHEMAVRYSEDAPGLIDVAAKLWRSADGHLRLTLYYPDRVEKYESKTALKSAGMELPQSWNVASFIPRPTLDVPGQGALDEAPATVEPNPYGRVPVFHFPNRRSYQYGISELLDVIPLQDGLNKAVCDMLVAMEYSAFRQRWVTGLEVEFDEETGKPKSPPFDYGADRIFAVSDANARFGDFNQSDLTQFLQVQENFRAEVARVSGTPLHYLFITRGDFPSGEAMKSAEARFTRKLMQRQSAWGNSWEDVIRFALDLDGTPMPDGETISAEWETASPAPQLEQANVLVVKRNLGVPRTQVLKELGYTDQQIRRFLQDEPTDVASVTVSQAEKKLVLPSEPSGETVPGSAAAAQTRATAGPEMLGR